MHKHSFGGSGGPPRSKLGPAGVWACGKVPAPNLDNQAVRAHELGACIATMNSMSSVVKSSGVATINLSNRLMTSLQESPKNLELARQPQRPWACTLTARPAKATWPMTSILALGGRTEGKFG